MSKLFVYKASAGSGKTFRLAAEYIKQVIVNPESYKNILAVTFTNKATAEMKSRILNELFAIANGEKNGMGTTILKELNIPDDKMRVKAKRALSLILHDYSRFSISTIDSFVQRVIQALLWEIGQQGGVDIELDTAPVLEHAADNLLDSASEIDELLKWLTSMGYNLLDEGKSWDVRYKLIELGKQLFSEKFRLMSREDINKFTDKERVSILKEKLQLEVKSIVSEVNGLSLTAIEKMVIQGINTDDFAYGDKGVIGFIYKCSQFDDYANELLDPNGTRVQKALNDSTVDGWVTKSTQKSYRIGVIEKAISDFLHPTLEKIVKVIEEKRVRYISAKLILRNLENLALIGDLWTKVRELSQQEGFLLLSDSGHLLREFVKESDAPFVYEKIGTRYETFMIDEFQDTSEVQWHNFKPLIDNSLSQDFFSMIVGDVKQSIYRWRNGDWRILATEVEKDFAHHGVNEISLDTNWRSLPSIISFNNTFFELAKDKAIELIGSFSASNADISSFQSQIEKAYKDLVQKLPESNVTDEGYVEVRFFEKGTNTDCDNTLSREIPQLIKKIKENHKQNDIAILVRTKGDGQRIANMLLDFNRNEPDKTHHISFVSQEGLQLKTSSVIRLMVAAFSLVQDASNEIAKRILAKEITTLQGTEKPDWHNLFDASQVESEAEWLSALTTKPLQEVFETIVSRYKLHSFEGELAHLAELQEHITNLSSKGGTDVNRFLHWWEQKGSNLALSVPDSSNALSIQTIHKSKGLQYPVVIVPYANWAFRQSGKSPLLWVSSNEEPFNLLPKYPILASNAALNSFFASDILEEEMREVVDNINLLYVAFTRPEKELYVFAPLTRKELNDDYGDMNSASKVLRSIVPNIDTISKTIDVETNTETYTIGKPYAGAQEHSKKLDDNSFWLMDKYPVGADYGNIKFKREAEEFFLSSPSERFAPLEHGKVMHELFSRIKSVSDIDNAIQELIIEGLVNSSLAELLSKKLKETLSLHPYNDWFSGNWEVKTEATILTPSGNNYRPDRVMQNGNQTIVVDFKFGDELPSHRKQILRYIDLLREMGYENIHGFIWYVESNKLLQLS